MTAHVTPNTGLNWLKTLHRSQNTTTNTS